MGFQSLHAVRLYQKTTEIAPLLHDIGLVAHWCTLCGLLLERDKRKINHSFNRMAVHARRILQVNGPLMQELDVPVG